MLTNYIFPSTAEEAVAQLAKFDGQGLVIAGGTDVLPDIEKGKRHPACLVDITRIPELAVIDISAGWATIGAAVPFIALHDHPYLASHVEALVEAAASVGALAVQTAATWVGNLVQAMPAADGAIIAVALEAEVRLLDAAGARWLPVAGLYAGHGRSRVDSTRQLITHIRFAIPHGPWGTGWRRAGRRPSLVLPTLNCAAKIALEGDRIACAAIAMGPVGPCPTRAAQAEVFLAGKRLEDISDLVAEAANLAICDANPRSSALRGSREHRLAVLPVLVEEALTIAVQRALADTGHPDHVRQETDLQN